jgi:hypothetical protein
MGGCHPAKVSLRNYKHVTCRHALERGVLLRHAFGHGKQEGVVVGGQLGDGVSKEQARIIARWRACCAIHPT